MYFPTPLPNLSFGNLDLSACLLHHSTLHHILQSSCARIFQPSSQSDLVKSLARYLRLDKHGTEGEAEAERPISATFIGYMLHLESQ